jgi:Zn2+/Cd2+-exporting ATPase
MVEVKRTYLVSGVCCSSEEAVVRKALNADLGGAHYTFSLITSELTIDESVEEGKLLRALRRAGFAARRKSVTPVQEPWLLRHRQALTVAVAGVFAIAGGIMEWHEPSSLLARGLLAISIVIGGRPVALKAVGAICSRSLDMNVLMVIAVIGAMAIDCWTEGAAVIVLFSLALMLESYSASRTRRAVQSLMDLSPQSASVRRAGIEVQIPADQVEPGEVIIIRPGERIPVDGLVAEGASLVNQATITGEPVPVAKGAGAQVFAGTLNGYGALHVRATCRFEDTTLAHIIHLVAEAEQQRAPVQGMVDRFAAVYTPAVLALAVVIAATPPLLFGASFAEWLYRALVVLVIACPCALAISTPVTIVSALTNAARRGILIKGGKTLELLSAIRTIAFDKTGTLTRGSPSVTDVVVLNGTAEETLLRIAGALEKSSEHHLASAILDEAALRRIDLDDVRVEQFDALPGRGVQGTIDGGRYFLGSAELCVEHGCLSPIVTATMERLTAEGKTAVVVGGSDAPLGVLAMRDDLRPEARQAIAQLSALHVSGAIMLSGDNAQAAEQISRSAGITEWIADLLPAEKVTAVQELTAKHGAVAMVGDGINDAPALAASTVGIAMGGVGSDTALETADVVLMADNLLRLPHLFALSKETLAVIKQNIALALFLKLAFLILSIAGVATLWMAVLADDGAALLVIANALRMLKFEHNPLLFDNSSVVGGS